MIRRRLTKSIAQAIGTNPVLILRILIRRIE